MFVKILTSATIVFIDIDYSVCQIMEMSSVKETCQSNQQKVERAAEQTTTIVRNQSKDMPTAKRPLLRN